MNRNERKHAEWMDRNSVIQDRRLRALVTLANASSHFPTQEPASNIKQPRRSMANKFLRAAIRKNKRLDEETRARLLALLDGDE